jgi:hypothetical protein
MLSAMDDHPASPTGSDAMQDESPPSSPSPEDEPEVPLKKVRKKRKPQTEEEKLAKKAKKRKAKVRYFYVCFENSVFLRVTRYSFWSQ